ATPRQLGNQCAPARHKGRGFAVGLARGQVDVEHMDFVIPANDLPRGIEQVGAVCGAVTFHLDGKRAYMEPDSKLLGEPCEMVDAAGFVFKRDLLKKPRRVRLHDERILWGLNILRASPRRLADESLCLSKVLVNILARPHLNEPNPELCLNT